MCTLLIVRKKMFPQGSRLDERLHGDKVRGGLVPERIVDGLLRAAHAELDEVLLARVAAAEQRGGSRSGRARSRPGCTEHRPTN